MEKRRRQKEVWYKYKIINMGNNWYSLANDALRLTECLTMDH